MPRYDWELLKTKFITGKATTIKQFSEENKLPYNLARKHSTGWLAIRRTAIEHKQCAVRKKTIEQQIEREVDWNTRHLDIFGRLAAEIEILIRNRGLNEYRDMYGEIQHSETVQHTKLKAIAQTMEIIQKGQRLALGLDKPDSGNQQDKLSQAFKLMKDAFVKEDGGDDKCEEPDSE